MIEEAGGGGAAALVPAAGSGTRFGGAKLWADLGGQPVLAWVLRALGDPTSGVDELVVAASRSEHRRITELASRVAPRLGCSCVEGGSRRQDSVRNALGACTREMVLIHDGARPGVTPELCASVLRAARRVGAASACVPVSDSTARLHRGRFQEVLPRADLAAIQTPQAFRAELLRRAHGEALSSGRGADDDAALVLALGQPVAAVPGDHRNLKVTRNEDLSALRSWLPASAWARR